MSILIACRGSSAWKRFKWFVCFRNFTRLRAQGGVSSRLLPLPCAASSGSVGCGSISCSSRGAPPVGCSGIDVVPLVAGS